MFDLAAVCCVYLDGTPKIVGFSPKSSNRKIRCSVTNHPFWGVSLFLETPKMDVKSMAPLTFQVIVSALFVFTVPESRSVPSDAHWATDLRDLLGRRVIQLLLLGWLLTGVSSWEGTSGESWVEVGRWLCRWIFQTSKLINCLLVSK